MSEMIKGLVVREPWIDLLLSGQKTWEMRSQASAWRGWIGLIRKGSGLISGVARLVDVGRPLSPDEMVAHFEKHRIPEATIRSGEVAKWTTPWMLTDVRPLPRPVRYRHPNGAITLFSLDADAARGVLAQLNDLPRAEAGAEVDPAVPIANRAAPQSPDGSRMPRGAHATSPSGIFIGETELTKGNIKRENSHFYIGHLMSRFPRDLIGGSNALAAAPKTAVLDWGGPTLIESDIDGEKKFFRKRGWVWRFYEMNGAQPEDRVFIEQVAPYSYRISLRKKGAPAPAPSASAAA